MVPSTREEVIEQLRNAHPDAPVIIAFIDKDKTKDTEDGDRTFLCVDAYSRDLVFLLSQTIISLVKSCEDQEIQQLRLLSQLLHQISQMDSSVYSMISHLVEHNLIATKQKDNDNDNDESEEIIAPAVNRTLH